MAEQTYSEDQVQKILARSLRLQEASHSTKGSISGFSIAELEEIAKEVGIEPEFLREALDAETDSFVLKEKHGKLYPKQLELSGNVRAPMTDEVMFDIVQLLREELGTKSMPAGKLESLGSSFEWATFDHGFSARSGKDETDFKMVYKAGNGKSYHFMWPWMTLAMLTPIVIGITKSGLAGLMVAFLSIITLGVLHIIYPKYYQKKKEKTIEVFKKIEEITVRENSKRKKREQQEDAVEEQTPEKIDLQDAEGYESETNIIEKVKPQQKGRIIP